MSEYAHDMEGALIRVALMEDAGYWSAIDVKPEWFSRDAGQVWQAIGDIKSAGGVVDVVTVAEMLEDRGMPEPLPRLKSYLDGWGVPSNVNAYVRVIREHYQRRKVKEALGKGLFQLDSGDEIGPVCEKVMRAMSMPTMREDTTFGDALAESMSMAEQASQLMEGGVLGVSTTLPSLDKYTRGLHGPKLVVLGGRPGTYKSGLALQIATAAATKGQGVGYVSMEMLAREQADRAIASMLGVDGQAYAMGDRWALQEVVQRVTQDFARMPLWIDDRSSTSRDVMARIVEWKYKHDVKLVVIDYLGLMIPFSARSKADTIGDVTRELKLLAQRIGIPILLLSQLNRQCEIERRPPRLSDLRDSGSLEQDADMVLFTYRQETDDGDRFSLLLAKQRGGPAGRCIDLDITGATYKITERSGPSFGGPAGSGAGGKPRPLSRDNPIF